MRKSLRNLRKLPPTAWLGLFAFAFATGALIKRQEPFYTWFYCFAWWPYILVIDGMNHVLEGESLLLEHTRDFIFVCFCSVGVWLVFEMFNLALGNWHYIGVPKSLPIRWATYFIAYATVLPGVFETANFLKNIGIFRRFETVRYLKTSEKWPYFSVVTGFIFLSLPLMWPRYFFPLVWLGFPFLLEPLNAALGQFSFVNQAKKGNYRELMLLLCAGGICGFLWELWNFWAGSKWIYTVPWVGGLKLFEMPVLGFLGFPPFAVECYVIMTTAFYVRERLRTGKTARRKGAFVGIGVSTLLCFALLVLYFGAFSLIDKYTVLSFK